MKKIYFLLCMLVCSTGAWAQKTWTGLGADGLWNTASNWSGGTVPISTDQVLFDNSSVVDPYTVTLPTGAVPILINRLTISPAVGNTITVILPVGNTNNPGFKIGDATPSTDDIIINNGGVLKNSSGAATGNGIEANSTVSGTVRINNGGKFIHNTPRSTGGIVPLLSTVAGTETGIYEYDSPGTGSIALSASGRNYGTLILTRTAGAAIYTAAGGSDLTIRGDFSMNAGVTYSSAMTGAINVGGNFTNNGAALVFPSGQAVSFNGSGNQTISGSATITFSDVTIAATPTIILSRSITIPATRTLTINGSLDCGTNTVDGAGAFTLGATGTLKMGSPLGITSVAASGNIQVTGTRTFNTGANYIYNGSAAQVTGDQLPAAVNDLRINNVNDVTLTSATTVNGVLGLDLGKLVLGANDLTAAGTITGGSSTNYIKTNGAGALTVNNITTGKTLPVGNAKYNPLIIENGSGHNWTARVEDAVTTDPGFPSDKAVLVTWNILPSVNPPSTGADITFQFDEAHSPAGQTGANFTTAETIQAWHRTNNAWFPAGSTAPVQGAAGASTVKVTGLTSFSPYALSDASGPLPITIDYFNGAKQGADHLLNWKVNCNSTPYASMILERSSDGRNYKEIYSITATATRCQQPFDYTSTQPLAGINYYRLKMLDANGKMSYSSTVALLNKQNGFELISVAPNPVQSDGRAILNVTAAAAGTLQIIVTDMNGSKLMMQSETLQAGSKQVVMNLSRLTTGTYQASAYYSDGTKKTIRFVKQ